MPKFGSITFTKLPSNFEVGVFEVSTNPAVQWFPSNGGLLHPDTDAYHSSVIGRGGRMNYSGGGRDPYNKATIVGDGYTKVDDTWSYTNAGNDFTFSGNASVWGIFRRIDEDPPKDMLYIGFNSVQFNGGHAVIDYTSASLTLPETEGLFKLTGIPNTPNNKYAILFGTFGTTVLYGIKGATPTGIFKGFPITDGAAEIPVFELDTTNNTMQFSSFDGTETAQSVYIIIQDKEDFDFLEFSKDLTEWAKNPVPANYPLPGLQYTNVQFTNGKTTDPIDYTDGTKVGGL
jgi:hypothetical protein